MDYNHLDIGIRRRLIPTRFNPAKIFKNDEKILLTIILYCFGLRSHHKNKYCQVGSDGNLSPGQ
jgi:hypothetical protein